ncbi:U6 snRNP-associated protein Lsm7 [Microbotryomycetes sp. JL221]|nr:U6 snRNP-associated protein Lsm7 [Microbotryomycetes sp. JL221]
MNSERGRGRGGAGGAGGRGGGGAGRGGSNAQGDRPKREAILDMAKYLDQQIRVKFTGGREVTGKLKGYDQLLNIVMDEIEEVVRDPATGSPVVPAQTRSLGLAVLRGTSLVIISPVDGSSEIANPFAQEG